MVWPRDPKTLVKTHRDLMSLWLTQMEATSNRHHQVHSLKTDTIWKQAQKCLGVSAVQKILLQVWTRISSTGQSKELSGLLQATGSHKLCLPMFVISQVSLHSVEVWPAILLLLLRILTSWLVMEDSVSLQIQVLVNLLLVSSLIQALTSNLTLDSVNSHRFQWTITWM